jgi:sugar (pentulose or hexulose) kinase
MADRGPGGMADRILALDAGTQSVRAMVFDPTGTLLGMARVPYEPYVSPRAGWAEQDAEVYWSSLGEACRRLWATTGIDRSSIAGVALTTQRATVVVTDAEGSPLRPAIVWLDTRRAPSVRPIGGRWGLAFRLLRVADTVADLQTSAEANWLRLEEPETWAATRHYLHLSGFLTHRLTGEFADSTACQVGYVPFDFKRQAWARPGDWRWEAIPIDPAVLPRLVPPSGHLGRISPAAADATGIPAGLPLVSASADKASEVLGSGALDPTIACLGFGTTATVNTISERYLEVVPLVPAYPAAVPGRYCLEFQVFRGFWMVEWFKRHFAHREVELAREANVDPEILLDRLLREAPAGSMGLVVQPYWTPGIRIPGPEGKGAIIGFGDVHTRAHVYRAILEGLGYALRDGLERTERRTGTRVRELRVSGGGSRGEGIVQLAADIFGLPAVRPHTSESAGLGAAIDAALGLGLHRDVESAVAAMTRSEAVHEPDPEAHARYDDLYRGVYLRMYPRLQPLYEQIRRITGYPAL